jgi:hypothetical protein
MRLCAVFGLCVAAAIAKVLILPPHPVLPNYPNYVNISNGGKVATESASGEISLAEPSLPLIEPPTAENLRRFRGDLPDARIPRELENAALAAGLVDPSKIDFTSSDSSEEPGEGVRSELSQSQPQHRGQKLSTNACVSQLCSEGIYNAIR